ncbi:MAG TPA: hypothetical protein VNJ53_07200 [Gaiellaceae bacterium]|nr:hypothetical protein [Gaiellaceae bacterium]
MSELERALVALGRELDVPEPPDLAPRVLAGLGARPGPRLRSRPALVVALVLAAALAATLAIPEARSALLRVLRIGGERIELVDELPEVPLGHDLELALGERVSPAAARRRAGFPLRELEDEPDRAYLGPRGTIWFLYGTPERPRLLLAQTPRLALEPEYVKKLVSGRTDVRAASVRGAGALFLSGAPHVFLLVDERGRVVRESARLARDVLVWEEEGVTYRLEGELGLEEALRLAESLR